MSKEKYTLPTTESLTPLSLSKIKQLVRSQKTYKLHNLMRNPAFLEGQNLIRAQRLEKEVKKAAKSRGGRRTRKHRRTQKHRKHKKHRKL